MIEDYKKFEKYQRDLLKDSILKFLVFQISTIRNIEYDVGKDSRSKFYYINIK